jgi:hypothetical protein
MIQMRSSDAHHVLLSRFARSETLQICTVPVTFQWMNAHWHATEQVLAPAQWHVSWSALAGSKLDKLRVPNVVTRKWGYPPWYPPRTRVPVSALRRLGVTNLNWWKPRSTE